jgi:hypothetical protein
MVRKHFSSFLFRFEYDTVQALVADIQFSVIFSYIQRRKGMVVRTYVYHSRCGANALPFNAILLTIETFRFSLTGIFRDDGR